MFGKKQLTINGRKVKAMYVGENGEAVKVWENGKVLNKKLFDYAMGVREAYEELKTIAEYTGY